MNEIPSIPIILLIIDSRYSELSTFNPYKATVGIFQYIQEDETVIHLIKPTAQYKNIGIVSRKSDITIVDQIIINLN